MKTIDYTKLPVDERKDFLFTQYIDKKRSFEEIAETSNTYSQKLRRDAQKFGIKIRSRKDAQSLALKTGRHKHPTKGTVRDDETKKKIGEKMASIWDNYSAEELQQMSEYGKQSWTNRTESDKQKTQEAAHKAILKSSKIGSKLERFISKGLIKEGYFVETHNIHQVINERLEIDILVPKFKIAIEIDGVSHNRAVWGERAFIRSQKADKEKTGLLLTAGYVLIRVRHEKTLSHFRKNQLLQLLLTKIKEIEKVFPPLEKRHIIIGEINE